MMRVTSIVLGCGFWTWAVPLIYTSYLYKVFRAAVGTVTFHGGVKTVQSERDLGSHSFHLGLPVLTWALALWQFQTYSCCSGQALCDQTMGSGILAGGPRSHSYTCLTLSTFQTPLAAASSRKTAFPLERACQRGQEHPLAVGSDNAGS